MTIHNLGWVAVFSLTCGTFATPAFALGDSDKEAVRTLSNEAARDFEQQHFEQARDKFSRAYGMARVPKLAVWLARANQKQGRLVAASELYREAMSLTPNDLWKGDTQQQAKKEAETELASLGPRIPKLTVLLEGAQPGEVALSVDNAAVASALIGVERPLDPGVHEVVAVRGASSERQSVTLAEGEVRSVTLRFAAASAPVAAETSPTQAVAATASPEVASAQAMNAGPVESAGPTRGKAQRTAGWIGVGVGVAGVALGAVTGILVAVKYGDLKDKCGSDHVCSASENGGDVGSYGTLRTVSTVGFIAGGALAAAGVTLLLTSPKAESAPSVGLWLSPRGAGVRGAF